MNNYRWSIEAWLQYWANNAIFWTWGVFFFWISKMHNIKINWKVALPSGWGNKLDPILIAEGQHCLCPLFFSFLPVKHRKITDLQRSWGCLGGSDHSRWRPLGECPRAGLLHTFPLTLVIDGGGVFLFFFFFFLNVVLIQFVGWFVKNMGLLFNVLFIFTPFKGSGSCWLSSTK